MSEILFEIYSEEIPARMQQPALLRFKEVFKKVFETNNIIIQSIEVLVSPCRVVIVIKDLPQTIHFAEEVIRGPKVDADPSLVEGFRRKYIDIIIRTYGKQEYYCYIQPEYEKLLSDLLPTVLTKCLSECTWPKTMHWEGSEAQWIRPIRNILAIFDGEVIPFRYAGLSSNNITFGHKFLSKVPLIVRNFLQYEDLLRDHHVMLRNRRECIKTQIETLCYEHNVDALIDSQTLDEVTGITEYPHVYLAPIPEQYMHLPEDILTTVMKHHQKYFATYKNERIADKFLFVANVPVTEAIVRGNQQVLQARLMDAAFFYNQDIQNTLILKLPALEHIVFHQKIGSMLDKTHRLIKIAEKLWPDEKSLHDAAKLAKCDLVTSVVKEFPEIRGIMGMHYAVIDNIDHIVAMAIRDHHMPQGQDDAPPHGIGAYLSIIDKLDTLIGLYCAGERATSSKDPFALRRYAVGIIKTIIESNITFNILEAIEFILNLYKQFIPEANTYHESILGFILERFRHLYQYSPNLFSAAVSDIHKTGCFYTTYRKIELIVMPQNTQLLEAYRRMRNIVGSQVATLSTTMLQSPYEINLYNKGAEVLDVICHAQDLTVSLEAISSLIEVISLFFDNIMVNDVDLVVASNRVALLLFVIGIFDKVVPFELIVETQLPH